MCVVMGLCLCSARKRRKRLAEANVLPVTAEHVPGHDVTVPGHDTQNQDTTPDESTGKQKKQKKKKKESTKQDKLDEQSSKRGKPRLPVMFGFDMSEEAHELEAVQLDAVLTPARALHGATPLFDESELTRGSELVEAYAPAHEQGFRHPAGEVGQLVQQLRDYDTVPILTQKGVKVRQ